MAWSAKSYLLAEVVPRFAPGRSYRGPFWVLGAISWHRWSHLYMRSYSGTATHEGDERASTTEKRARATRDKGEAFPMLKHWKRVEVTNETTGNRQLALNQIHSYIYVYIHIHLL